VINKQPGKMGKAIKIIKRTFFTILIVGLLTVTIIGLLILISPNPPIESLNMAQAEIGRAKDVEAQKYAKPTIEAAEDLVTQAQFEWKVQNQSYAFLRDYGKMLQLTKAAIEKAKLATEKSLELKSTMHTELSAKLKEVEKNLNISTKIMHTCHSKAPRDKTLLLPAYAMLSRRRPSKGAPTKMLDLTWMLRAS
jgi:hypothetical protein